MEREIGKKKGGAVGRTAPPQFKGIGEDAL
jgi:hypothetical protein